MNRHTAKVIHELTNLTYWGEKPNWDPGNLIAKPCLPRPSCASFQCARGPKTCHF